MAEKPPLICIGQFGVLQPKNGAARDAIKALNSMECRIEIKRSGANERRRGFYWTMLDVAAEALTDATGFHWDQELLHKELKIRLKLGDTFVTPSGHEVFKPRSTSNRAMNEAERARWTDRCAAVLSTWLQCEIAGLMDETRRRNGEPSLRSEAA
jgi:hypothetical protein